MNFDRKQTHYLWEKFLEWDKVKNVQFNYNYVAGKNSLEFWIYFETLDGERLRTDAEFHIMPHTAVSFLYNWPNEDLDRLVENIMTLTESDLEQWQKV